MQYSCYLSVGINTSVKYDPISSDDIECEFDEFEFEFEFADGDTIVFVIGISPGDSLSPSAPFVPVLVPLPPKNR